MGKWQNRAAVLAAATMIVAAVPGRAGAQDAGTIAPYPQLDPFMARASSAPPPETRSTASRPAVGASQRSRIAAGAASGSDRDFQAQPSGLAAMATPTALGILVIVGGLVALGADSGGGGSSSASSTN
jgi:hypothetical protein